MPVILSEAKNPRSLPLDAERKTQLQTRRGGFARPKARRAQDDKRLQNCGSPSQTG
jgi:hypothetical protein